MTNPALFEGVAHNPCDLALEFVDICRDHPVHAIVARGILVKMLLPLFASVLHAPPPHTAHATRNTHMCEPECKSTTTCARCW